jgi:hypothetical protein
MDSVSTYIHHQIAVIVTNSDDVNRHSSSFNMATVMKKWFNNKCSCFSGNSKETEGGYSAQDTRIADQRTRSSFSRQCSTSQCCPNRESLEVLGLWNSSTSIIESWFGTIRLPSIPRDEIRTSEFSASTPMKMLKMRSRNGYVPRTNCFSMKDLTNWYIIDKCLNGFGDYVEK